MPTQALRSAPRRDDEHVRRPSRTGRAMRAGLTAVRTRGLRTLVAPRTASSGLADGEHLQPPLAFESVRPWPMNGVLPFAPLILCRCCTTTSSRSSGGWRVNQDVVYGAGIAALERSPVVVVVRISCASVLSGVDLRTDGFAQLGACTERSRASIWVGHLVRSATGDLPGVRSATNTAFVVPLLFCTISRGQEACRRAQRRRSVRARPVRRTMKPTLDSLPKFAPPPAMAEASGDRVGVRRLLDQLHEYASDAPPLPGRKLFSATAPCSGRGP